MTPKVKKIFTPFFIWKLISILSLILALNFVPLANRDRFLGAGLTNYQQLPALFAWANFDGEHYLSIAIFGYKGLEQAFFPVYPILISFFSRFFYSPSELTNLFPALFYSTLAGLFISHLCLLLALFLLWDLLRIDYPEKIALLTIILILIFPTSFYLGAIYSESTYLLFSVSSFYLARKKRWFWASAFGLIGSATRIFGVLLLPALLIEVWQQKESFKKTFWIFLIPFGLLIYIYYQYVTIGDPLAFYHLQKIVGEQHQSGLTLLPQVYYRYLKIFLTVNMSNPVYQTAILEFIIGLLFFILPIVGYFKKVRLSYLFYSLVGFLLPTIQGSFSSLPRYVLVFFPSFLILALWLDTKRPLIKFACLCLAGIALIIETILFLRGYWVA